MPLTKYAEYFERYQQHYHAQMERLAEDLTRAYARQGGDLTKTATRVAANSGLRDAWGTNLRIERLEWDRQGDHCLVRSAGPDKQFGSGDDLTGFLEVRGLKRVANGSAGPSRMDLSMEHDRGPMNGLAEFDGSAVDQQGGALEGATVTSRGVSNGVVRSTVVNADGRFTLAGIPEGEYEVKVTNGSETVSRKLTMKVRDRAVLSAMLRQKDDVKVVVADFPVRAFQADLARFQHMDAVGLRGAMAGGGGGPRYRDGEEDDGGANARGAAPGANADGRERRHGLRHGDAPQG